MIYNYILEQIKKVDIEELCKNEVSEGKQLDYKEKLNLSTSTERLELMTDIASFANTFGGDILFGIVEKRDKKSDKLGISKKICGLEEFNYDIVKQQIENAVRDSIQPRLTGIQFHKVDGFEKGPVFIIRIPRSINSPHLVSKGKYGLFYARNNAGKYPMDIGEIRTAFLKSHDIWDRIRLFRTERISKLLNDEGPVPFAKDGFIIHHVVPIISFQETITIDFMNISNHSNTFDPMHSTGRSERYNFDGLIYFCNGTIKNGKYISYIQLFRNGIIESSYLINLEKGKKIIPRIQYEKDLLKNTYEYINVLRDLSFPPPYAILISLVNVDGFRINVNNMWRYRNNESLINQSNLILPEIIIENFDDNIEKKLRPVFDIVWQSAGYHRSMNFDKDRNWTQGDYKR